MRKATITSLACFLLIIVLNQGVALGHNREQIFKIEVKDGLIFHPNALNIPDWKKDYIESRTVMTHYNSSEVFAGYTLFNCDWDRRANQSNIIMDMEGNIVAGIDGIGGGPELINSTTIMTNNNTHVMFWNLETNGMEYVPIPEGVNQHHDLEYDPNTGRFLYLGRIFQGEVESAGKTLPIAHDLIIVADREGNILVNWSTYDHIPFNATEYWLYNFTLPRGGGADWTHGNTVFWDLEEGDNIVYYNARHLHTMYKIDLDTGKILWALGAYNGNFTLYDKDGNEKPSLFYGAHSVERIGPNRFIIYDNDFYNITDLAAHTPSFLIFEVDEEHWVAREIWRWEVPDNDLYLGERWGDADLLPDGTVIGPFGAGGSTDNDYITEVNMDGEIVWEIAINGTDTYRAERFYLAPIIKLDTVALSTKVKHNTAINLTVWNSFRERMHSPGKLEIASDNDDVLLTHDFTFLPYWQPTNLSFEVPTEDFAKGSYNLTVTVTNADGLSTSLILTLQVEKASAYTVISLVVSLLAATTVLRRKKHK